MPPPSDVNSPDFWEEIYQGGRAGWDLGRPTPALQRLLAGQDQSAGSAGSGAAGGLAPGALLVVGAGRGHDAREFARHGFSVTAVDFADDAVRAMTALADPRAPVEILQADIFALPAALDQRFDYILEYTCFCAIDPARRAEYADVVARLLRPGGTYIALLFPLDEHAGGPPFAVSAAEVLNLFGALGFTLLRSEVPADSVPQRQGLEQLLIFQGPARPD